MTAPVARRPLIRHPWTGVMIAMAASLLPHLGAVIPGSTYYFRDFTVTFYPLRVLWATELAAGRLPTWNPYVSEGAFLLPALYPVDLLHALFPGPAAVSWLLTMHFPLAALGAYLLARDLGAQRTGAAVSGAIYSLGGLALSALNLFVFLQALALAPLVVFGLRRAALRGPRWIAIAAVFTALALSTLAVEFVAQAVALGIGLALVEPPPRGGRALRVLASLVLGACLAAVPLVLTADATVHSVRGSGFPRDVVLGNEVHPVALLQVLVPGVMGSLRAPVEEWWGARFYTKGFPYFLSLYLGPCALALAAAGVAGMERRRRHVLGAAAILGLWYALGAWGGLALALSHLPPAQTFRFPSKALLLPYLAAALFGGLGADRLRRGDGWRTVLVVAVAAAAVAGTLTAVPWIAPAATARALALGTEAALRAGRAISADSAVVVGVALVMGGLAVAALRRRLAAGPAAIALAILVVVDLARAGMGMNPQVTPAFYSLLPELRALALDGGGRVFSYGLDASPAFRQLLASGQRGIGLWSFFLSRQVLAPYANVIDRIELAEGKDLTSFVPRVAELGLADYEPARVADIIPVLRGAAVTRVIGLDTLSHPDLALLAEVPAGPPGVFLRVYALSAPAPRAYVACRVLAAAGSDEALARARAGDVDPGRDVVLESPAPAACTRGSATLVSRMPGRDEYDVESDGAGFLVTRDSYAPNWTAAVEGERVTVLRANGKHRAVPIPGGRHRVRLRYAPCGLPAAVWVMAAGMAVALILAVRTRKDEAARPLP